mgnify:FL=1
MKIEWKENGVEKSLTIKADSEAIDVTPTEDEVTSQRDFAQVWIENERSGRHLIVSGHNLETTGFMTNGAQITKKTYRITS